MSRTIEEINEKIQQGKAVIATAEEIIGIVKEKGIKQASKEVDVVTTGTFGPMCSSGAYLNIGHSKPRIKLGGGRVYLNDVPAYAGFAAVDIYIGAGALPDRQGLDPDAGGMRGGRGRHRTGGGRAGRPLHCGRLSHRELPRHGQTGPVRP